MEEKTFITLVQETNVINLFVHNFTVRNKLERLTFQVLHYRMTSLPYPQTLNRRRYFNKNLKCKKLNIDDICNLITLMI